MLLRFCGREKGAVTRNNKISICRLIISLLNFLLKKSELIKPLNTCQVLQILNHFCSPVASPLHFVSLLSKKPLFENEFNHFTVASARRWRFLEIAVLHCSFCRYVNPCSQGKDKMTIPAIISLPHSHQTDSLPRPSHGAPIPATEAKQWKNIG